MRRKVTKAIFPVAGMGTRFLPATKSVPKEIMTLVDRPLIQYAIDEARAAGIKEFIFVTSRGKSALEDYFDHAPDLENSLRKAGKDKLLDVLKSTNMESGAIAYIRQHKAMGLGHAVSCARRLIGNEPFAVILPDDVIAAEGRGTGDARAHLVDEVEHLGIRAVAVLVNAIEAQGLGGRAARLIERRDKAVCVADLLGLTFPGHDLTPRFMDVVLLPRACAREGLRRLRRGGAFMQSWWR